ncbi:MAG TPA: 2-oxoglutarate ferredoxin oxidoreductase subunit alpha, partial [Actinomycetota bacterium]|nr:2-oxoglutarate ferredoxin oxidoreductase subunit alpha [Actinomycetota bacterium]
YEPENHEWATWVRAAKVQAVAEEIPPIEIDDPSGDADLLVIGWGSTYGAIRVGVERLRAKGRKVARAHLYHMNPLPKNTAEVLRQYRKILIPEMNLGQLWRILRAEFLAPAELYSKVQGQPIFAEEIEAEVERRLG